MILLTLLLIIGAAILAAVATRRPGESALARFLGGLALGVGLLITLASGLCTAGWLAMTLHETVVPSGSLVRDRAMALGMAAVFGAGPFIVGVAMVLAGALILRRPKPPIK